MAKKHQKKKLPTVDNVKKTIGEAGDAGCNCNWAMAVECVDDLMEWVNSLCRENHKLKETLKKTIDQLGKDNKKMQEQLDALPGDIRISLGDTSVSTQDH